MAIPVPGLSRKFSRCSYLHLLNSTGVSQAFAEISHAGAGMVRLVIYAGKHLA